eukprot:350508-Chlamydomonas_euryale.AAC.6
MAHTVQVWKCVGRGIALRTGGSALVAMADLKRGALVHRVVMRRPDGYFRAPTNAPCANATDACFAQRTAHCHGTADTATTSPGARIRRPAWLRSTTVHAWSKAPSGAVVHRVVMSAADKMHANGRRKTEQGGEDRGRERMRKRMDRSEETWMDSSKGGKGGGWKAGKGKKEVDGQQERRERRWMDSSKGGKGGGWTTGKEGKAVDGQQERRERRWMESRKGEKEVDGKQERGKRGGWTAGKEETEMDGQQERRKRRWMDSRKGKWMDRKKEGMDMVSGCTKRRVH